MATRPLKMSRQNESFYYFHDGNKNVTALTDEAGNLVQNYNYKTFGAVKSSSEQESSVSVENSDAVESSANLVNPFQFSSEYYDSELNLVYYNYRHYDPETGRFLSKDPIAEQGCVNLYNFVQNNPVNRIDLLGLIVYGPGGPMNPSYPEDYAFSTGAESRLFNIGKIIRSFLSTDEEKRAWDNYTSGSGKDIELSSSQVRSILESIPNFKSKINSLKADCIKGFKNWSNKEESIGGQTSYPWTKALGGISIKLVTNCTDCQLIWNAEINDLYDYDVKGLDTDRSFIAEVQTALVALAAIFNKNWKTFYHRGETDGIEK